MISMYTKENPTTKNISMSRFVICQATVAGGAMQGAVAVENPKKRKRAAATSLTELVGADNATDPAVVTALRTFPMDRRWFQLVFQRRYPGRRTPIQQLDTCAWLTADHPFVAKLREWCRERSTAGHPDSPLPAFVPTFVENNTTVAAYMRPTIDIIAPPQGTFAEAMAALWERMVDALRGERRRNLLRALRPKFDTGVASGLIPPALWEPVSREAKAFIDRMTCPVGWLSWRIMVVAFGWATVPHEENEEGMQRNVDGDALLIKRLTASLWASGRERGQGDARYWFIRAKPHSLYNIDEAGLQLRQVALVVGALAAGGVTPDERLELGKRLM